MSKRYDLQRELEQHAGNVYFQPPSTIKMTYPCVVYNKISKFREYGNDQSYIKMQGYNVTVMDRDPDSFIAEDLEDHFVYCAITQYFTNDNIHHTVLELYY